MKRNTEFLFVECVSGRKRNLLHSSMVIKVNQQHLCIIFTIKWGSI